jgi:hypothetical protein
MVVAHVKERVGDGQVKRFFAVFGGASELGEAEFASHEIKHGDHVNG